MPVPSGRRSSWRIGGGFTISNPRKSIKPSSRDFHAIGTAISVISCPATSSMTTNCGSFNAEARATRVAAGIPTQQSLRSQQEPPRAARTGASQRASSHHRRTVAAEPQVPGPGCKRPTPKNVAISVAQEGARGGTVAGQLALGRWRRRRYAVGVARFQSGRLLILMASSGLPHRPCPAPATKLRTRRWPICPDRSGGSARCKRETPGPSALHRLLADRATQLESALASHWTSHCASHDLWRPRS